MNVYVGLLMNGYILYTAGVYWTDAKKPLLTEFPSSTRVSFRKCHKGGQPSLTKRCNYIKHYSISRGVGQVPPCPHPLNESLSTHACLELKTHKAVWPFFGSFLWHNQARWPSGSSDPHQSFVTYIFATCAFLSWGLRLTNYTKEEFLQNVISTFLLHVYSFSWALRLTNYAKERVSAKLNFKYGWSFIKSSTKQLPVITSIPSDYITLEKL